MLFAFLCSSQQLLEAGGGFGPFSGTPAGVERVRDLPEVLEQDVGDPNRAATCFLERRSDFWFPFLVLFPLLPSSVE